VYSWIVSSIGDVSLASVAIGNVLTALLMKVQVFWDVTPFLLVNSYQLFQSNLLPHSQTKLLKNIHILVYP